MAKLNDYWIEYTQSIKVDKMVLFHPDEAKYVERVSD